MNRRRFMEASSLLAGGTLLSKFAGVTTAANAPMIGIQAGAASFVDEGAEKVLDSFQEMAWINTIFVATFTYGRGIAGRQIRGQPLPDHGKQEYDDNFRGGNFATPHPRFYSNTSISPDKAPDHPGYDVIADVLPAAHKRNIKIICWFEDVFRSDVRGFDAAAEIDINGKRTNSACHRNPNTRNFWLGLTEDYLRSYDVDGLMWGSERQGPLDNALGAKHGSPDSSVTCFCQYCLEAASREGINANRAREGYRQLQRLVNALRGNQRPTDGAFVSFWRLLVKYPEILAWERLWNDALNDTYRDMYKLAHSIAPTKPIGWHIWHNNSFSPFYRAEQDYGEFSKYSDFLKVVMYNNCGGERLAQYIRNLHGSLFADLNPDKILEMTYGIQQYSGPALSSLALAGLPAEYVLRETKRAVAGVAPHVKIWPGIDIDIPTASNSKKTQPDDVYKAVKAAFQGSAQGVLLSRKYSEMRLDNIRAAGRAIRELKLA